MTKFIIYVKQIINNLSKYFQQNCNFLLKDFPKFQSKINCQDYYCIKKILLFTNTLIFVFIYYFNIFIFCVILSIISLFCYPCFNFNNFKNFSSFYFLYQVCNNKIQFITVLIIRFCNLLFTIIINKKLVFQGKYFYYYSILKTIIIINYNYYYYLFQFFKQIFFYY